MKANQIVLTGVSRGLGLALAERFIQRGHTVHGCARSATAITKWRKRFGPPHSFEIVDVSRDDQVRDWAKKVLASGGPPDLLINNAAVINRDAPLWEVAADDFAKVVDVNVKGVASVIRHFVPAMIARASGVIVNITSGWGRSTAPEVAPYCASKWAIEGLTLALAQELPNGMAAIPLNPGIINTEMLQSCFGSHAVHYPDAETWAEQAVTFLLDLGPKDNGRQLSISQVRRRQ